MLFYLGTHEPSWITRLDVPLFLSRRRLIRQGKWPKAKCRWSLDSGGFTELSMKGAWGVTPEQYAQEAKGWADQLGGLDWASPQDWMCEPWILEKTGKTVEEHQRLTIQSVLRLRELEPSVHWVPVLQGWAIGDYFNHLEMYSRAGFDLTQERVVGVGSVCRRQGTTEATELFKGLHACGLKLHGFGLKLKGLKDSAEYLASADSMAWSYNARKNPPLPGCTHPRCNNCILWATRWREKLLLSLDATHPRG